MCGHQRSFRIYNYDKSDDDLKSVLVLGADGPIYATEREVKQCWLFYAVGQSIVMLDTYKSHEIYEYDKIAEKDLYPPKRLKKFKFIPFLYSKESKANKGYREFLLNHRISREELSNSEDLNLLFALDRIKERSHDVRFNVFDFLMERSTEHPSSVAETFMRNCLSRVDLKLRVNTMRLNFGMDLALFDKCFNYNHLVYRTDNFATTHVLSERMLKCGYLCLRAKIENIEALEDFTGWGLHILDPHENNVNLGFIRNEITKCAAGETSRKLTALTRIAPEKEPLFFEDAELLDLLNFVEDLGLECSFKQEEEYDVRKFLLPSGVEAALVVKHIHYTKYSSIAFISIYSDIMLKFVSSGCESFFM